MDKDELLAAIEARLDAQTATLEGRMEAHTAAVFPDVPPETAEQATDGLFALGSAARRTEKGRREQPLTPARVHMMFRGLPPLYACVNPECSHRRNAVDHPTLVGRLYTEPRNVCECGARVFELLTHRDCGSAYLRAFGQGPKADFLWTERGGVLTEYGKPLHELHILLEEPHPDMAGDVDPIVLHMPTGRILSKSSGGQPGTRLVYRPIADGDTTDAFTTFPECPVCKRRTQTSGPLKIMDLATKGEQPFANLAREQLVTQIATKPFEESHPNGGRKVLLFSDGRQKAARLARDLPREVERDSFREAMVLATNELVNIGREPILDKYLYCAFVAICERYHLHFFDKDDQKQLIEECKRFRSDYDGDLKVALEEEWSPTLPVRYRRALLRQICDPYYHYSVIRYKESNAIRMLRFVGVNSRCSLTC